MSRQNVIRRALSAIWRFLDFTRKFLHLVVLLVLVAFFAALFSEPTPTVPRSAALVVSPRGVVVEQLAGDPVERAFSELSGDAEPQTLLRDLVDSITAAQDDDRIGALVLDLNDLAGAGLSKLQAIGRAIRSFKESGKPVIAISSFYDQNQYYLAAMADEVYMHPFGLVYLDGYGHYRTFYKQAIDKLAIDWNIFKVGEYKSFVEPFIRDDMSEEDKTASMVWLNELWSVYVKDVTEARGLEEDVIGRYIDQILPELEGTDGDMAVLAKETGLVDELWNRDEIRERLIELVGTNGDGYSFSQVNYLDYLRAVRPATQRGFRRTGKVGVIVAAGEVLDGEQPPGAIGGDSLAQLIRQVREDDSIDAVVLRIDSGGGSTFASYVIARELTLLRSSDKPLVVSMSSVAASAAYWISLPADEIWAAPTTLTGSIGIFAMFPTVQRTLDKLGVHVDGIGTTWLSGEFRIDRELGGEAQQLLQMIVEDGYRDFIDGVADARGMTKEEVDQIARGRVWIGTDAHRIGLVDELGNLDQAVASAAALAGLGERFEVEYIERELGFVEALALDIATKTRVLFGSPVIEGDLHRSSPLVRGLESLRRQLVELARLNDPRGVYSHCFCNVL